MHPTIRHGDVITVEPVLPAKLKKGDIILYRFQRGFIAHRIVNILERDGGGPAFILRGDASATCDAPVEAQQVLGKVVFLERGHRTIDPYSLRVRTWSMLYLWLAHLKRCVLRQYQKAYVGDKYCSKDQGASRLLGTKHYTLGTKAKNAELGTRNAECANTSN